MEYRGVLLGEGSAFSIASVEGLLDLPDVRNSDRVRLLRHGLAPGSDWLGGRVFTITLELYAADNAALTAAVNALGTAFAVGELADLTFQIPGVAGGTMGKISARCRRRQLPVNLEYLYRIPLATIEMAAPDPLLYSASATTVNIPLAVPTGGLTFPATFPLVFGTTGTFGSVNVTNSGNANSAPTFRVYGPVTNPSLTNYTSGTTFTVGITLASGEFLDIDMSARTVLLGGTGNRYSYVTAPNWWELVPGVNEVRFTASTGSSSTDMTFRSAWS